MRSGRSHPQVWAAGRHRRIVRLLLLLGILLVVYAWQQGYVGQFMRMQINHWFLPRTFMQERVTLQPMQVVRDPVSDAIVEGVRVVFSPAWVRDVLQASPWPRALLPPGALVDGLATSGSVAFPQEDGSMLRAPFYVEVRDRVGLVPQIQIRFPAASLNQLLDASFAEDWTDTGEYLLGSYDYEQRLRFDSVRIRTIDNTTRPLYPVILQGTATGRLHYRFRDGWVRMRVTAGIRELTVTFILIPIAHPDGIGFDYQARIDKLDLRVKRMPKWMERRLSRAIRSSLERSLNHRRKRERLARNRFPLWLPMAIDLDAEIVNPPLSEDAR
jgi:hypothetical protein